MSPAESWQTRDPSRRRIPGGVFGERLEHEQIWGSEPQLRWMRSGAVELAELLEKRAETLLRWQTRDRIFVCFLGDQRECQRELGEERQRVGGQKDHKLSDAIDKM